MMNRFEDQFSVNNLYKKSFLHVALWAWISALRMEAGYSRKDAIISFKQFFNCDDIDDLCIGAHYNHTNNFFKNEFDHNSLDVFKACDTDDSEMTKLIIAVRELIDKTKK